MNLSFDNLKMFINNPKTISKIKHQRDIGNKMEIKKTQLTQKYAEKENKGEISQIVGW